MRCNLELRGGAVITIRRRLGGARTMEYIGRAWEVATTAVRSSILSNIKVS